jgi:hypothetical protein
MAAARLAPLLALSSVTLAHADSQLWLDPGFGVSPSRRVGVDVTAQARFDRDVTRFAAFLPELTCHYRLKRWLRVGGGYRFEYERDSMDELVVRNRVSADARFRVDSARTRLTYRLQFVERFRPMSNNQYSTVLRNRVEVAYRGRGAWQPWGGVEVFHMLDDFDRLEYDRTRFTAGTVHNTRDRDIAVFLRVEIHADPAEPTDAILGLAYHYEL